MHSPARECCNLPAKELAIVHATLVHAESACVLLRLIYTGDLEKQLKCWLATSYAIARGATGAIFEATQCLEAIFRRVDIISSLL